MVGRQPARVQRGPLAGLGGCRGVGMGRRCLTADTLRSEVGDPDSRGDGGGGDGSGAGRSTRQASSSTAKVVARSLRAVDLGAQHCTIGERGGWRIWSAHAGREGKSRIGNGHLKVVSVKMRVLAGGGRLIRSPGRVASIHRVSINCFGPSGPPKSAAAPTPQ